MYMLSLLHNVQCILSQTLEEMYIKYSILLHYHTKDKNSISL